MPDKNQDARWWVSIENNADGPHTVAYVELLLAQGRIQPATLVCQVGESKWKPLSSFAEWASKVQQPPSNRTHASSSRSEEGFLRQFTNPALPWFANWICVYCILFMPALTGLLYLLTFFGGLNTVDDLRSGSPLIGYAIAYDIIVFIVDVPLVILLVFGGLLLCKLQKKGAMLVKVGIAIRLVWGMISLLAGIVWGALVTLGDEAKPVSDELTSGETVFFLLLIPLFLLALVGLVFEVVALIWLIKNDHKLPLTDPPQIQEN